MDEVSCRLYGYLCDKVVGTEEVVNCRRQFFKVYDSIKNSDPVMPKTMTIVSSGSKAEGMILPGSDFDIMIVVLDMPVYEKPLDAEISIKMVYLKTVFALSMDTDLAQPGFALLRLHNGKWSDNLTITTEFGTFLSGRLVKTFLFDFYSLSKLSGVPDLKINGPCLTDKFDIMDTAFVLKCETWPRVAKNWLLRPRTSGWPSRQLISTVCKQGILLVPVGSKSDSQEENPLEWRISFSIPEKLLIHSWNHTQFLCYGLLKLLTKEVVKKNKKVEKLICSYFFKTTILWLSEEQNLHMWTPTNLLSCFLLCIKRLIYWNICNYIPNYFIPQHNMIDRKIPGQSRAELVSLLRHLYSMGWTCLLLCQSLQGFNYWNPSSLKITNYNSDKANFSELSALCTMHFAVGSKQLLTKHFIFAKSLVHIHNDNHCVDMRRLYLFLLKLTSSNIAKQTVYDSLKHKNKHQYLQQRQWLSRALIGTYSDSLSGWVLIAWFFYLNREYIKSVSILNYAQLIFFMGKNSCSLERQVNCGGIPRRTRNCRLTNFFRNIRLKAMLPFKFFEKIDDCLSNQSKTDIILHGPLRHGYCPIVVFFHYLSFLCYYRLRDHRRCEQSLAYLLWTVENDCCIEDNRFEKGISCHYLSAAYAATGDFRSAMYWISLSKRYTDMLKT